MGKPGKQIKKILRETDKITRQAAKRAINRSIQSTRKEAAKYYKSTTGVKSSLIKSRIATKKAKGKKTKGLFFLGLKKEIGLHRFNPKEKFVKTRIGRRLGATVKVGKQKRRLSGGFMAEAKGGKRMVFQRTGNARYPIEPMTTDVLQEKSTGLEKTLSRHAEKTAKKVFEQEMSHRSQKAAKKKAK